MYVPVSHYQNNCRNVHSNGQINAANQINDGGRCCIFTPYSRQRALLLTLNCDQELGAAHVDLFRQI